MAEKCLSCGAELNPEEKFCTSCGAPIAEASLPEPIPADVKAVRAPKRKTTKKADAPKAESEPEVKPEPEKQPEPEVKPEPEIKLPEPEVKPVPVAAVQPQPHVEHPVATIPAPEPVPVKAKKVRAQKEEDVSAIPKRLRPLSTTSFVWLELLFALPVIGFIAMVICAIPRGINRNVRGMARAGLLWLLIGVFAAIVIALLGYLLLWPTYGDEIIRIANDIGRMFS